MHLVTCNRSIVFVSDEFLWMSSFNVTMQQDSLFFSIACIHTEYVSQYIEARTFFWIKLICFWISIDITQKETKQNSIGAIYKWLHAMLICFPSFWYTYTSVVMHVLWQRYTLFRSRNNLWIKVSLYWFHWTNTHTNRSNSQIQQQQHIDWNRLRNSPI